MKEAFGSVFDGIYCGHEGEAHIHFSNVSFHFQWWDNTIHSNRAYKFEINQYLN